MATLSEHADAIKAAIQAAWEDGYRLEFWPWTEAGPEGDRIDLTINLINLRRVNGYMQVEERLNILEEEGI